MDRLVNPCDCGQDPSIKAECGSIGIFSPEPKLCDKYFEGIIYRAKLARDKEWVEWLEDRIRADWGHTIEIAIGGNDWQSLNSIKEGE